MGNAPNKTAEYSQLVGGHTKPSPADELTFRLEPFGPFRARWTESAGGSVTLKIHQSHAELWVTGGSTNQPTERWALCNIASWGHTSEALRLVVQAEKGHRCIYDFKTTEGQHVTSALKQFSTAMVETLRQAKLRKALHQTLTSCCNTNKAEATNAPTDQLVNVSPADGALCLTTLQTSMNAKKTRKAPRRKLKIATHQVVAGEVGPNIFNDHRPTAEDATHVLLSPRSAMAA